MGYYFDVKERVIYLSFVFFSNNLVLFCKVDMTSLDLIKGILGFKQVDDLGFYLGVPIFHERVTNSTFRFVVDKIRSRLNGWDVKLLSMIGRMTNVKSILLASQNYFMQSSMLLVGICNEIEKLARSFV